MKIIINFNNLLALLIVVLVVPGLWIADALGTMSLNGEIKGATIAAWALVIQHYFRKKMGEK